MNIYEFASNSPWLAFFLAFLILEAAIYPFKILNRWIRHRNIVARGWPPAHCDADGDAVTDDE